MTWLHFLEYLGSLLGVLGGFLVTSLTPRTRWWAFIVWLISDVVWIVYGCITGQYGLCIQYVVYSGTSGLGWWRLNEYFKKEYARWNREPEVVVSPKPRTSQSDPTLSSYPD